MFCVLSGPLILKVVGPQVSVWSAVSLLRHKSAIPADVQLMSIAQPLRCGGGSLILDDDITFFLHLIENCSFIRLIDHTKLYSNSQPQSRKIEEDNFSLITFFSSEHPCKKQPPFTIQEQEEHFIKALSRYKIDINDVICFSIFDNEKWWLQMQIFLMIQNGRFMFSVT